MYCRTWDELYEDFEQATLQRANQPKNVFGHRNPEELERLNTEITRALHELRQHEQIHRCNG